MELNFVEQRTQDLMALDAEARRACAVKKVLKALPKNVRDAGRRKVNLPSKIEEILGYDPASDSTAEVTDDERETRVYGSTPLMTLKNLGPTGATALTHAVD